ncbi:hypothetical protein ACFYXH_29470 [Streptomyces sp. NPDC002730]|uniref:hypothetical protein n=1 Tax=Streptomyces sp. NPDC002730 TaxID=3364662 RepID=UPI0036877A06
MFRGAARAAAVAGLALLPLLGSAPGAAADGILASAGAGGLVVRRRRRRESAGQA